MMFFGNVAGGLFVVLFHVIGVTNIDNSSGPSWFRAKRF